MTGVDDSSERPETDWVAAHVFYHDRLDPLLTEVVAPLGAELGECGLADDFFFLRYWDGGPHLRFRALMSDNAARAATAELIRGRFAEFLTAHPASGDVDRSTYERSAERLAQWESLSGYAGLRPNNSVEFRPYQRERERYGYGRAVTAVEEHFGESSRLALRLLSERPDAGQRFTAAYSMITLSWLPYVGDPAWRSTWVDHADPATGDEHPPTGARLDRDDLEARWRRQRDTLCALTERLRVAAGATGTRGDLTDWIHSIERLKHTLTLEVAAGRFTPPTEPWGGTRTQPQGRTHDAGATSVLPVIDICSHLFCNRLGLSPTEEAYVRVLAMRAACETERTDACGGTRSTSTSMTTTGTD